MGPTLLSGEHRSVEPQQTYFYFCYDIEHFLYQMYGFASIVSGMVSIWSIMVLSLERLWVIYWASRVSVMRVKMSTMRAIIITMWLMAIIMATLPLLGYSRYVYEVTNWDC